jgi:serine/threonine protein kinase
MELTKSSIIYQNDESESLCELCQEDMGTEENPIMSITSEEKNGYCNHTMCSVCVKNYVDNKIEHGEVPNCPWCSRVIVGIEKGLLANTLAVQKRALLEKKERALKQHLEALKKKDEDIEIIKSAAKAKEEDLQNLKSLQQTYEAENQQLKKKLLLAEREREEKKALEIQIAEAKQRDVELSKKIEEIELEKEEYQNRIKVMSISHSNLEAPVENAEQISSDSGVGWSDWLVGSYIAPLTKKIINVASNQVLGYDSFGAAGEHVVTARIQFLERRGRRRDSNVFHAKSEDRIYGLTEVAIKKVKLPAHIYQPNLAETEDFSLSVKKNSPFYSCFREAMIMSSLKHTHIMKFLGASREVGSLNLIMPFVGCDLEFYSYGTTETYFSLPQVQQIAYALLSALNYLHSANIVHRDIRLSSILLKMSDEPELNRRDIISIKLSNFQNAHSLIEPYLDAVPLNSNSNGLQVHKKFPPTLSPVFTMAPEVSLVEHFDYFIQNFDWKAADIWALGNALVTLVRGGKPYFCQSESNNIENLVSNHIEKNILIKECRPEREILNQMLGAGFPVQKKWSNELISISKDVLKKGPELPGKKKLLLNVAPDSFGLEDLIAQMIHFNPQARRTCSFLLQNRFFSGYKPKNHSESSQEWVSKIYPFSDKSLYNFAEKCGGEGAI